MRKLVKILLFALCMTMMICVISGCGSTEQNNGSVTKGDTNTVENDNIKSESSEDKTIISESDIDSNSAENTDNKNSSNILVAYFSATGITKGVAENIAGTLSADLYEIVPKELYSSEDLDYNDNNSRSSIEMNDKSSRPEISESLENIENYDVIFLGYPIWWGEAPHIIYTFMESYDFSEKTIIPFCTSASSGIGASAENIHSVVSDNAVWLEGDRLSGNSSREDIANWINDLGLDVKAQ